jgi:hypothetical protein
MRLSESGHHCLSKEGEMVPFRRHFLIFLLCFPIVSQAAVSIGAAKEKVIAFAQDTMANDFRKEQVFEVRDALAAHPEIKFVSADAKGQTSCRN